MARYIARVWSAWTPERAFAFMADMRTFPTWDPGVTRVTQVRGEGDGPDAVFDVTVAGFPRDLTLRYATEHHDPGREVLLVGRGFGLISTDRITVTPAGDGALVTYDADLSLPGPLRLGDLALRPAFQRIGGRAERGMRAALTQAPVVP